MRVPGARDLRLRAALASVVLCLPALASAAPDETPAEAAMRLTKEGLEAYGTGDFDGAVQRFEEARTRASAPILLYYLGRSNEKLQRTSDAVRYYREYIKAGPDPGNEAQVRQSLEALKSRLPGELNVTCTPPDARVRVGGGAPAPCATRLTPLAPGSYSLSVEAPGHAAWAGVATISPESVTGVKAVLTPHAVRLVVTTVPEGATVSLDGQPVGRTPLEPIKTQAGHHVVKASAAGRQDASQVVTAAPGEERRMRLVLPLVPRTQPAPKSARPAPMATAEPLPAGPAAPSSPTDPAGDETALLRASVAGAVVVLAAIGMGFAASAHSDALRDAEAANDLPTEEASRLAWQDAEDREGTATLTFYGLGVVALAGAGWAGYEGFKLMAERSSATGTTTITWGASW